MADQALPAQIPHQKCTGEENPVKKAHEQTIRK